MENGEQQIISVTALYSRTFLKTVIKSDTNYLRVSNAVLIGLLIEQSEDIN